MALCQDHLKDPIHVLHLFGSKLETHHLLDLETHHLPEVIPTEQSTYIKVEQPNTVKTNNSVPHGGTCYGKIHISLF